MLLECAVGGETLMLSSLICISLPENHLLIEISLPKSESTKHERDGSHVEIIRCL